MASRSRGRHRKNNTVGNTRMDAALDAMRPFGFDEALVRQTVGELLDVYEGQGWFFIEDTSYNLLIDTMLHKQISSEEKNVSLQDNARKEGDTETSAATRTTAISEASSSNLVAHGSLLRTCDGLNSVLTNDPQDSASLEVGDQTQQTKREGIRVEPEGQKKLDDDAIGSNNRELEAKHIKRTLVRPPVIESPCENPPVRRRKPCYGWISDSDEEDLIRLPLPPLPEEIQKLLEQNAAPQSGSGRRRKSRWDEKPSDTMT